VDIKEVNFSYKNVAIMELTHLFNTDNIGVGEQRERWIYTRKSDIIGIKSALW
jgi:hypothetical protein